MPVTVKMTSKRQITFPSAACKALDIQPGDSLTLADIQLNGKTTWVLIPPARPATYPWQGALRSYAERKDTHDMTTIRKTVAHKLGTQE